MLNLVHGRAQRSGQRRALRRDLRDRRRRGRGVRGRLGVLGLEDRWRGEVEEARDGREERGRGRGRGARRLKRERLHGVELGPVGLALCGQGLCFGVRRRAGRPRGGGTSWFGVFGGGSGGDF